MDGRTTEHCQKEFTKPGLIEADRIDCVHSEKQFTCCHSETSVVLHLQYAQPNLY